jgi:hypothetical protein
MRYITIKNGEAQSLEAIEWFVIVIDKQIGIWQESRAE